MKSCLANILGKVWGICNIIKLWGWRWTHPPQDRAHGRSFGICCAEPSGFTTKKKVGQVICGGGVGKNIEIHTRRAACSTFRLSCSSMWGVPTPECKNNVDPRPFWARYWRKLRGNLNVTSIVSGLRIIYQTESAVRTLNPQIIC
jgi:hypothetical protein